MSSQLIVSDTNGATKMEPIGDVKGVFDGCYKNTFIEPAPETMVHKALNHLLVSDQELTLLRQTSNGRAVPLFQETFFAEPDLLQCCDLVGGSVRGTELFIRAIQRGVDQTKKSSVDYQCDLSHMIKLPLSALMEIGKLYKAKYYNTAFMSEEAEEEFAKYFDCLPALGDLKHPGGGDVEWEDLTNKKLNAFLETRPCHYRIEAFQVIPAKEATETTPAVDEVVRAFPGFKLVKSNIKNRSMAPKLQEVQRQKRKRDDDEIAEKIERGKHIEKVVDLKDARYFTFVGSYDVDNAKFVKGPDGQCSLLMPYNNA